ncbi:uncharacterized protein DSM5745_05191 [Aspergillus mulundensis]|uniref:SMODS and SLOG-associating 2TM effector domain-containing protein n=1 Tax=Aspergillus mulundensis TaxID=1810919 RepID=A0A3D8S6J6_9EURO|nr:Uncharacterized protein DSM5745_05191 [Aspergillus mulundensis]RDW81634.1 Uncharacterized protein DSM5745_05191 [Aspergillus mulundensis]
MAALDREEKGYPPPTQTPPPMMGSLSYDPTVAAPESAESRSRHFTLNRTDASVLIPPSDKLLVFRALTGIDTTPALNLSHHTPRTAPNIGIYTRVVKAETHAASRYRFHAILINTCLGIQIVVAAALTALGAARGPHNAVTAFGAINTIVAGVLTYLKGSGLPDRLKHYQNEWRNIREYIEQRERELCLQGCELDVEEEIQIIEQMYEGVKREIEATKSGGDNRVSGRDRTSMRRPFIPQSEQRREYAPRPPSPRTPGAFGGHYSEPQRQYAPRPPSPVRTSEAFEKHYNDPRREYTPRPPSPARMPEPFEKHY